MESEYTSITIGRPAKDLNVTIADRAQLESIARSQSLPAGLSRRARMILRMADGETNSSVARRVRVSRPTVLLVPAILDIHLISDYYGTHKHAKVKAWLARRPRFHLHFTPTYSTWLNQVERWFALITQQAIRLGSFGSVTDLKRKSEEFVKQYNQHPKPFAWTATAESILAKIERLCKVIDGTAH